MNMQRPGPSTTLTTSGTIAIFDSIKTTQVEDIATNSD
jgi:hypothetical protein